MWIKILLISYCIIEEYRTGVDLVSPYIILYYIEEYRTGVCLVSPYIILYYIE